MSSPPNTPELSIRFWGVRGSIATPKSDNLGYGGNTTCLQITVAGSSEAIIIDGGTGLRMLGETLSHSGGTALRTHALMTHFHSDHIQGIPFFSPLFHASNELFVYSDRESDDVRNILAGQMASPYFPVPLGLAAARREYVQLKGEPVAVAGAMVSSFPLNHPQGAAGYRIEASDAVIVHASDHEHGSEGIDRELRRQCQDADILIYDAQYTPEEYTAKRGWGHSTYVEAARVANDCGVKHLILFHHDPLHNDEFMSRMVDQARKHFEHTDAAREDWEIRL